MIKSEDIPAGGSWNREPVPAEGALPAAPLLPLGCNSASFKV